MATKSLKYMSYSEIEAIVKSLAIHASHLRDLLRARDRSAFRKVLSECKELIPYSEDAYQNLVHAAYTCEEKFYQTKNVRYYDELISAIEQNYGRVFKILIEAMPKK